LQDHLDPVTKIEKKRLRKSFNFYGSVSMRKIDIAVIGGSGLYQLAALKNVEQVKIETPYGQPSADIIIGELDGVNIAFLARHGLNHQFLPTEVPYRANIYALKLLGVRYLISISAVGSLREHMKPLDMVIPDQFIDLTKHRESSFFGQGAVAHVSMADPVCSHLAAVLAKACQRAVPTLTCHPQATYVCIEGPQFSSRAESNWFRQMQADIIGMTNMPEAKLAREASRAYATLALVTDYDCWHPHEMDVSADYAIQNLKKNVQHAALVIQQAVKMLADRPESSAHHALEMALVTQVADMSAETYQRLRALLPDSPDEYEK
jgi:5'-methylthioadenosine phosphorylase